LGFAVGVERLAMLADPEGKLDRDQRLRRATQALDRFERYIQLSPTGCHLWMGSVTADGYGQFALSGRLQLARRVAYELWVGPIGPNERVFSRCGVRACVNHRHLEAHPVAMPTLPDDRFTREWIETEAGSWFLGLWTADGYLSRDASMSLALKDHDAVHLAAVALGLNVNRVGLHKKLDQARIRVGVKWFLPHLAAIGIAPGPKTGREHAPLGLEHNRHFWRGVVDGDGWVRPEQRVMGLVTASPVLRDQFAAFLDTAIGCTPTLTLRTEGTLYQLTLTGRNAAALASLLYGGSTFALPRKRAAALLTVEGDRMIRTRAQQVDARNRRIVAAYEDGCSGREIATLEAVSAHTVYYILRRAGITRRPREWYATQQEFCSKGHPFDERNTRIERNGVRRCRTCARDRGRAWARSRRQQRGDHV
jgi:DNA-binding CsgD family transcriptional regulator